MRPVRDGGKSIPPGPVAVAVLALVAIGLLGCGEVIDGSKVEAQVQSDLEKSLPEALESGAAGEQLQKELGITPHEKIASVDCPSEQGVDPGTKFSCSVEFSNGRQATETLKILNKEAGLKVVSFEPSK